MKIHNLPSLSHLLTKQPKGKEPLVNYFQSHVITFEEYHAILKKKTMEKVDVNEARETKKKQKKDGRLRKVVNTPTQGEQATLLDVKRQVKATFDAQWSPIASTIKSKQPCERLKGSPKPPLMHNGPM